MLDLVIKAKILPNRQRFIKCVKIDCCYSHLYKAERYYNKTDNNDESNKYFFSWAYDVRNKSELNHWLASESELVYCLLKN